VFGVSSQSFVGYGGNFPSTGANVPASVNSLRMQCRSEVERSGEWRTPIHKEGAHVFIVVVKPDTSDITSVQSGAITSGAAIGDRILWIFVLDIDAAEE